MSGLVIRGHAIGGAGEAAAHPTILRQHPVQRVDFRRADVSYGQKRTIWSYAAPSRERLMRSQLGTLHLDQPLHFPVADAQALKSGRVARVVKVDVSTVRRPGVMLPGRNGDPLFLFTKCSIS